MKKLCRTANTIFALWILATIDECAIATGDRELCMYQGVPQTSCEGEGCCFDTNSSSCYFSNAEGILIFGTRLCFLI